MILLVHQLPEQVNMFLEQILDTTSLDVYIHVNKRNDNLRDSLLKHERIFYVENNVEITWGSEGIITAILNALKVVNDTKINYGHVLINTGQDMIIRPGLDQFLNEHSEEIYFESYLQDKRRRAFLLYKWPNHYRKLMDFKFNPYKILRRLRLELFTLGFPFCKKRVSYPIEKIKFYRNWFWGALPLKVVQYILDFIKENPDFMDIYKGALVPEEGFMVTIIMMSPFKDWIHFDENGYSKSLTNVLGRSNGHPTIVRYSDIKELDNSDYFFSRKFDIRIDSNVVHYYYNKSNN